ncbi:transporter [Geothrix sp. PMB-07]|uniref:transporter n=1 Tax=Geothrix sp. PMB-07 TaxID=3068640 RepID=UPI002741861B|nr:transporter [Geothrix sp. PMB-07]WLT30527.1 transporter [Geothrix sp. PMB-07]
MRLNIIFMTNPPPSPLARLLPAFLLAMTLAAQEKTAEKKEGPIQDNSFLVEEAYNQEAGVVQHISTFTRYQETKDWLYTFTQEWPIGGITHQLSYTLPWQRLGASLDGKQAFGDVALNYRYQLLGDGDAKVAVAPRLSVLLPTGDEKKGYGRGATGVQVMLPVSWVLTDSLVSHWNIGATRTPNAKNTDGEKATTQDLAFGQSFIWLANPRFNVMLEYVHTRNQAVVGPGRTELQTATYLSPGIRWAYNFPSGLQIVPGIAVPIGVGASRGEKAIFLYLSFEHPFLKGK